jgi:hypothetical protein
MIGRLIFLSFVLLANELVVSASLNHAHHESRAFNTTKQVSELPPTRTWPHHPLFVKSNPDACGGTLIVKGLEKDDPCPIGVPFEFESELFKGKLLFRVRDLPTSADHSSDSQYFRRRNNHNQFIIQGRFKKEIKASNVVYGGEFKRPLKRAPPAWLEGLMSKIFSTINSGIQFRLSANTPSALVSLPGSVQVVRADPPGFEPDITSFDLEENNSAFGLNYTSGRTDLSPVDSKSRKKFFSNLKKSKDVVFDTDTVYTFEHYDDIMDYKNYVMDLGVYKFDMSKVLDAEPFQIMAKDLEEGKHLWSFQLWHEKLL